MKWIIRLLKWIICLLIGHSIDPMMPTDEERECDRCGQHFPPGSRPREDIWFWLTWWDIKAKIRGRITRYEPDLDIPF